MLASYSTTCSRAERSASLGNVPLHRSRVVCPLTWLPPASSCTLLAGDTSCCRTTSPCNSGADGSLDTGADGEGEGEAGTVGTVGTTGAAGRGALAAALCPWPETIFSTTTKPSNSPTA